MHSVALNEEEAIKRRMVTHQPPLIDCYGTFRTYIFSTYCYLFLGCCLGKHPLMNDLFRTSERRNGSCVHSPLLPGDVARRAAAFCRSPEDDPPGTARSSIGDGD